MKKALLTTVVGLLVVAALGAAHWYVNLRPQETSAAPAPEGARAIPVEASAVKVSTVVDEVSAVGTLRSNESVVIRPELAGRISVIAFEEGEPVEQGVVLLRLDDTTYRAELADAQASLNLASRTFERLDDVFKKGSVTARERDEALAQLESARAALQLVRARLDKTDLVAPFSGILGLRRVSPGDYVTPGQDLVNLEDIDPLKVDFRIPERFLSSLRTGQDIRVVVDAFPGRTFEGNVYAIDPQIDPGGRSIAIRARIDNDDRVLRPGLFARVRLIVDVRPRALVVPEQAIVPRGDSRYVFRIVDGKAVLTEVHVGQGVGGEVEILAGLDEGDMVVTAGHLKIRDGVPVTLLGAAPQPANGDGMQDDSA